MKVLILVGSIRKRKDYLDPLVERWHASNYPVSFKTSSLQELKFTIFDNHLKICDHEGIELSEYDLVAFRAIGTNQCEAITVAKYCEHKSIRYVDSAVGAMCTIDDSNKLGEMAVLALGGLPVPDTVYGSKGFLLQQLKRVGLPAILKAIDGKKGQNNYIITSAQDLDTIHDNNRSIKMLLQQYVPNDGDYRVLTVNYDRVVVTLRKRKNNRTHLNNISAGGSGVRVTNFEEVAGIITLSKEASKILKIEAAGTDIVVHNITNKSYIMEVNRAPELTSDEENGLYFGGLKDICAESRTLDERSA